MIPLIVLTGFILVLASMHLWYRSDIAVAKKAWDDLATNAPPITEKYDPAMTAHLPEIARRYFAHAIAPGTPLSTIVQLKMQGTFLLGDATEFKTYNMQAQQILAAPGAFVWMPEITSGPVRITGSDALTAESVWTHFWIQGLYPIVREQEDEDLRRSGAARPALESIWAPASLLPQNGALWETIGDNQARITFDVSTGPIAVLMTLAPNGRVLELEAMRWSNVNAAKQYRLQPFGGTVEAEASFGGYTIPSQIHVGNHFGTSLYLPFFQARITDASYL